MHEPDEASADRGDDSGEAALEDAIFMKSYIPRTLNEVYDPERDVGALSRGEGAQLIYKDVIGLVTPDGAEAEKSDAQATTNGSKVRFQDDPSATLEEGSADGGEPPESGEDSSDSESDGEKGGLEERRPRGHRHEDREAKKVCSIVFPPHGTGSGTSQCLGVAYS